jgi:hypothetical protein
LKVFSEERGTFSIQRNVEMMMGATVGATYTFAQLLISEVD